MIKSIRHSILGNPHVVVFSGCSNCTSVPGVEDLLRGSYHRLPPKGSINSQSACITQSTCMKNISKGMEYHLVRM